MGDMMKIIKKVKFWFWLRRNKKKMFKKDFIY